MSLSLWTTVTSLANLHNFIDLIKIPSIWGWTGPAVRLMQHREMRCSQWTISHPEGLPSGHAMHTYTCSSCFPVPLRHSSQQVSSEKVRPQMSDQIKRKSIQNTLGQKTFVDCTHSNMHSTFLSFPQETKYKITLEWGEDLKCPEFWVYLLIIFTWWGKVVRKFKAIWTFLTEKFHFKHSKIFKNFF